jgi:hypothetical protein
MKPKPFMLGLLVGVPAGWRLLAVLAVGLHVFLSSEDLPEVTGYRAIKYGMSRVEVERLMGGPGRRSTEFHLSQRSGYDFEYEVASRIGAAYFLSWSTGFDTTITVAFDRDDTVIYKASGDT